MIKHEIMRRDPAFVVVNLIMLSLVLGAFILSSFVFGSVMDLKILIRVLMRGMLGLLFTYDALYLIFTPKGSYFLLGSSTIARRMSGILLLLVGLMGLVTACLGYGVNGDPRLIWWK